MAGRFEDDGRRSDMLSFEEIPEKTDNLNPQLLDEHINERRLGYMRDRAGAITVLLETLAAQRPATSDADAVDPNSLPRYDANRLIAEAMKAGESAPIPTGSPDPEKVANTLRSLGLEHPRTSQRVVGPAYGLVQPLLTVYSSSGRYLFYPREQYSNELNPPKLYDQTIKEKEEDNS